ncbi:hypothetical protein EOT10_04000 [Streptomyces antnestii]|uniref:Uncharacterized protein n=2 Tax=Streptomyces antnestii TaxID=2494256 RepID=A0A3S2W627_9ACTN|nr:hypothetical protein EOT10_04000 [Streptomyces sp. San01]
MVIENVRGLLSTRAGTHTVRDVEPCPRCMGDPPAQPDMRALGLLLADLADLGYDAAWCCVHACDIGAPHRRARVFLASWPAMPLPGKAVEDADGEPGQQRGLPAPGQTQGRGPRSEPGRRGRASAADPESERRCQGLSEPALQERQFHPGLHGGNASCRETTGRNTGATATCPATPCRHRGRSGARCHRGRGHQTPAAHPDLVGRSWRCGHHPETQRRHESADGRHSPARWWGDFLPAIRRWEHVSERAAPSPTQPGTRRLSAEFVEWMMGLPAGWVTGTGELSRAAQLHLLGNSVVTRQAAHAINLLLPDGIPPHAHRM